MSWIHLRGVGPGRWVGNILAALKVSSLLVFIALGFSIGAGSSANFQQAAGPVGGVAWLLALIPVMFTYSGWNAAAYLAEEVRDPGRNVPLALGLGTLGVIAIYLLLNLLYLYVLPVTSSRRCGAASSTSSPTGFSVRVPETSWASCPSSASRPASAR